jgi:hypothetical protein
VHTSTAEHVCAILLQIELEGWAVMDETQQWRNSYFLRRMIEFVL